MRMSQPKVFLFITISILQLYVAGLVQGGRRVGSGEEELRRQMSLLRAATTTRIDEQASPTNITAIRGETAMLVCRVINIGDKAVTKPYYCKPREKNAT